jgi:hypothetical protein
MKSILFMPSLVAGAVALAPACSANPLVVGHEIDAGGPLACALASGTCVADASAGRDAGTADASPGDKDSGSDGAGSAGACASAGGTCVEASVPCALSAPARAQDCSSGPPNPAGAYCCLALPDAGSGRDGGAQDGGPSRDDGGNSDGGEDGGKTACAAAGGTCIGPAVGCAIGAPGGAQDCTPPRGGTFCCLSTQ